MQLSQVKVLSLHASWQVTRHTIVSTAHAAYTELAQHLKGIEWNLASLALEAFLLP